MLGGDGEEALASTCLFILRATTEGATTPHNCGISNLCRIFLTWADPSSKKRDDRGGMCLLLNGQDGLAITTALARPCFVKSGTIVHVKKIRLRESVEEAYAGND